jgi:hypothetical protein
MRQRVCCFNQHVFQLGLRDFLHHLELSLPDIVFGTPESDAFV